MLPNTLTKFPIALFLRRKMSASLIFNPDGLISRIQTRLITAFSKNLCDDLPLDTPRVVYLETTNLCNYHCFYCPSGDNKLMKSKEVKRGYMTKDLFSKLVTDLASFPKKIPSVYLHLNGEPLLHKSIVDFVKILKSSSVTDSIRIITNGHLLDEKISESLIDAGLDMLIVSIEHIDNSGYKQVAKVDNGYTIVHQNVKKFNTIRRRKKSKIVVYAKIIKTLLSNEELHPFYSDFKDHVDIINVEQPYKQNNMDDDPTFTRQSDLNMHGLIKLQSERTVCPSPFFSLGVAYDGQVSPCCVDWSNEVNIGNANNNSLLEIWEGVQLQTLKEKFLKGQKKDIPVCDACDYMQQFSDCDELDNSKEILLNQYSH